MSISGIILAAVVVGGTGLVISILLGIASEKFKVPVDEKEVAVRECLPGNNCGGCGFAGCDALAKAIAAGDLSLIHILWHPHSGLNEHWMILQTNVFLYRKDSLQSMVFSIFILML